MYTHRIIHFPAIGKGPELRAALEARNASGNAAAPHALSVLMFSPQPAFIHAIRFENLAAIEAYGAKQQQDSTFQSQAAKISAYLDRERASFLYQDIGGTGALKSPPRFLIRNRYSPAPGKGPELRSLLEERLHLERPGLAGIRLERQIASPDGPSLSATLLFGSMADMDEFFAFNDKDASFPAFLNKVASLSRGPVLQRIHRVLAPFPM